MSAPRSSIVSLGFPLGLAVVLGASSLACSSSPSGPVGDAGGPLADAADMHCTGVTPIVVDPLSCNGTGSADGGVVADFGETLYNAEGDDDDCKYHVRFTTTPAVTLNGSVTVKVTVTKLADGTPATGAVDAQGNGIALEGYLGSNAYHVLPNTTPATTVTETPAGSGVYTITPVKFDAAGVWIARFHLFETCTDELETSPHGHVAFFMNVP